MIIDLQLYNNTSYGSAKKILCSCSKCNKELYISKQKLVQRNNKTFCHPCATIKHGKSKEQINVTCKTCNIVFKKRHDTLKNWGGNCASCGQKELKGTPEMRKKNSERAREQVLKQGGIPNARMFTTESASGSNSYTWRGGITPIVMKIRLSKEMQQWRKKVFARDNYTCVLCSQRGGNLEADHIMPFSLYPDLRFNVDNGRTLCNPCHRSYGAKVTHGKLIKPAVLKIEVSA